MKKQQWNKLESELPRVVTALSVQGNRCGYEMDSVEYVILPSIAKHLREIVEVLESYLSEGRDQHTPTWCMDAFYAGVKAVEVWYFDNEAPDSGDYVADLVNPDTIGELQDTVYEDVWGIRNNPSLMMETAYNLQLLALMAMTIVDELFDNGPDRVTAAMAAMCAYGMRYQTEQYDSQLRDFTDFINSTR